MAQVLNYHRDTTNRRLSDSRRVTAQRRLQSAADSNPLRRVMRSCQHSWVRDTVAVTGDHLWCDLCADFTPVLQVAE